MRRFKFFIVLTCIFLMTLICVYKCNADAEHMIIDGVKGYFIPEQDFTDMLLIMNEWEYYKNLSSLLQVEVDTLNLHIKTQKRKTLTWKIVCLFTGGVILIDFVWDLIERGEGICMN